MFTIKKYIMRPSKSVEFYSEPQEFLDFVKNAYIDTGKITKFREKNIVDDEGLILEITTTFVNKPTYEEFRKASQVQDVKRMAETYYLANGVTHLSNDEQEE